LALEKMISVIGLQLLLLGMVVVLVLVRRLGWPAVHSRH
jgi:hypothetical protein